MTARTPLYGIEYLVAGEPIRATRLALENNAKTIEAALASKALAPPGTPDLAAAVARIGTLETAVNGAPQLVPLNTATWSNWADSRPSTPAYERLHVVKVGNEVRLRGLIGLVPGVATLAAGTVTTIGTLPAAYRPPSIALRRALIDGSNAMGRMDITPTNASPPGVLLFTIPPGASVGQANYVSIDCSWSLLNGI